MRGIPRTMQGATGRGGKATAVWGGRLPLIFFIVGVSLLLGIISTSHRNTRNSFDVFRAETLTRELKERGKRYRLLSDSVVYDRYARVYSRRVRFPSGREFEFDVWGRNWRNESFGVVAVVPFCSKRGTFTLLREYNVAHDRFVYTFPQGQVEVARRHRNVGEAAEMELEEEAKLRCGKMKKLLQGDGDLGAPQDKYQRESVHYFLCVDPMRVEKEKKLDAEENIEIVKDISPAQLVHLVKAGTMQSNNMAAAMLALHALREERLL